MSTLNRFLLIAVLLCTPAACGNGVSTSVTPQPGGGISKSTDGGVSNVATVSAPVTPCSQTGLIFTSGCNAILYVVLF